MPFNDLIPNQELMYAGGSSTVRGYSEGCAWGKSGYTASAELHFLFPFTFLEKASVFAFADHAGIFPYPDTGDHFLLGIGAGLELNLWNILRAKAAFAWPLFKNSQDTSKDFRISLSVTVTTPNGKN